MKARLSDIARIAKVSPASVSSVLNGKADARRISEGTVERIRRVARDLGYVPNYCARGLRTQRTHNLGLLIDVSMHHLYLIEIINHLGKYARNHGYHLNIGMLNEEGDVQHYLSQYGAGQCDGVLAVSVTIDKRLDTEFKTARDRGMPIVLVYCGERRDYDCVCPDLYRSAELGVEYLVGQGRRRIACVGHDLRVSLNNEYVVGYRQTLERHGIEFDAGLVWYSQPDFEMARRVWEKIARVTPQCDGILAFNDDIALGLARGIRESGLRIPSDIMIVAQNNTYPVRIAETPLASTQYDLDRAAEAAIRIITERLESTEEKSEGWRLERVEPRIVGRIPEAEC